MTSRATFTSAVWSAVLIVVTFAAVCSVPYVVSDLPVLLSGGPDTPVTDFLRLHIQHAIFGFIKASEVARGEVIVTGGFPLILCGVAFLVSWRRHDEMSRWSRVACTCASAVHLSALVPRSGFTDGHAMAIIRFVVFPGGLVVYALLRSRASRHSAEARTSLIAGLGYVPLVAILGFANLLPAYWAASIDGSQAGPGEWDIAESAAHARADTQQPSACWSDLERLKSETYPVGCGPLLPKCPRWSRDEPCWAGPYWVGPIDNWKGVVRVAVHEPDGDVTARYAGDDREFETPDSFNDDDIVVHVPSQISQPTRRLP